jgi:hypothetical protein
MMMIKIKNGHLVGKYNGQKIVGFNVNFILNCSYWDLLPKISLKYSRYISWLCLTVRWEYEYGDYVND